LARYEYADEQSSVDSSANIPRQRSLCVDWDDLNTEVISAFLDHHETDRHNNARSRNARLAALRSLFHYAALRHPEYARLIQQVQAIPQKRVDRKPMAFLNAAGQYRRPLAGPPPAGERAGPGRRTAWCGSELRRLRARQRVRPQVRHRSAPSLRHRLGQHRKLRLPR
jgi:Phage integrase, N-terminal SAM-like domain